ncbi:MAG: type IV secretory system conjugative DNA transfer family protein, partial [Acidobacteria bacterium]|nr:type IV secretory system conjugative DNA transfer family protein [Acidobacteriota bacterium]
MDDFEKLGLFYLGRPVDPATRHTLPEPFLLDSRDLTTHAVCVGMTGSGKTGLCLSMLEEAAIDGVPVIAIDPKGDVANLLLSFPALDAASFAPWVSADEAARAGVTVDAFAEREATKWREGLAGWGQDGARITRMREAADFVVYTPGSKAGTPLSVLSSLAAPPARVRDDEEVIGDRVSSTVGALLSLLGVEADPRTSRDHILLSTIVHDAWTAGRDLTLSDLIHHIQKPGMARVGVLELESFYPEKDRFAFATRLNNLLASPGFAAWLEGEPLDIGRLLHNPQGKPKVSIISI